MSVRFSEQRRCAKNDDRVPGAWSSVAPKPKLLVSGKCASAEKCVREVGMDKEVTATYI